MGSFTKLELGVAPPPEGASHLQEAHKRKDREGGSTPPPNPPSKATSLT